MGASVKSLWVADPATTRPTDSASHSAPCLDFQKDGVDFRLMVTNRISEPHARHSIILQLSRAFLAPPSAHAKCTPSVLKVQGSILRRQATRRRRSLSRQVLKRVKEAYRAYRLRKLPVGLRRREVAARTLHRSCCLLVRLTIPEHADSTTFNLQSWGVDIPEAIWRHRAVPHLACRLQPCGVEHPSSPHRGRV